MAMPPRGGITASRIAHLLSWSSSRVTAAMTRTRCMPERRPALLRRSAEVLHSIGAARAGVGGRSGRAHLRQHLPAALALVAGGNLRDHRDPRSEEHTSELQSLMRISYAVFCLKKKKTQSNNLRINPYDITNSTHIYNTLTTIK